MSVRRFAAAAFALLVVAAACHRNKKEISPNLNVANKVAARSVTLYYEAPDLLLAPEVRTVPLPENSAAALPIVMRELLKGSANAGVPKLFPADAVVRAAYLLPGGLAIVDLGGPTLTEGWNTGSHTELMAAYSIVQTATSNFAEVKRVRIVVNGQPVETLGGHVDLTRSLSPQRTWVRG
jgi:spore germination protein GerM